MEPRQIFRQAALEKLASPERLDTMIEIIRPAHWLFLVSLGLLIIPALIWSVSGSVAIRVDGQGMIIADATISEVLALNAGQISRLDVQIGDTIQAGQVIATLGQPELIKKIERLEVKIQQRQHQDRTMNQLSQNQQQLMARFWQQRRQDIKNSLARLDGEKHFYEEKIAAEEKLAKEGIITENSVMATRQQYHRLLEEWREKETEQKEIAAELVRLRHDQEQEKRQRSNELAEMSQEREAGQDELARTSTIVSSTAGRVLEIKRRAGDYVEAGRAVVTIEALPSRTGALQLVLYVPLTEGKKIIPGMELAISPAPVRPEEYGFLRGRVSQVAPYPASAAAMLQVLRNQDLVNMLSLNGVQYEIRGELESAKDTPSGYRWSSRQGPPTPLQSGTYCTARITLRHERPIALLIPFLKKLWPVG
jgi:HlyD family secretion protein